MDVRDLDYCLEPDRDFVLISGDSVVVLERVEAPFDDVAALINLGPNAGSRPPADPLAWRWDL